MHNPDLLALLGDICTTNAFALYRFPEDYLHSGDATCVKHIGALTLQVASKLSVTTAKARYELGKLRDSGEVVGVKHNGSVITWWPVGLAEKMLAQPT